MNARNPLALALFATVVLCPVIAHAQDTHGKLPTGKSIDNPYYCSTGRAYRGVCTY